MRTVLTVVLAIACAYFAYQHWTSSPALPEDPTQDTSTDENSGTDAGQLADALDNTGAQKPARQDLPPLPSSEKGRLRSAATGEGADADRARWELARILIKEKTAESQTEAISFLRQVFDNRGELAVRAAGHLLQLDTEERPAYASFIVQQGDQAPPEAIARASYHIGQTQFEKREDSAKIEAWKNLSKLF